MSYKNKDRLREYDKNYQRQYRQDKKARGECRHCKSPVFKSHSVCEKHLDEQRVTPEVKHGYNLKARYRVPKGVYFDLFDKQEGRCAICGRHQKELKHKLSLDHDHATGVIRGLLCDCCNRSLGGFRDSISTLEKARGYLLSFLQETQQ